MAAAPKSSSDLISIVADLIIGEDEDEEVAGADGGVLGLDTGSI